MKVKKKELKRAGICGEADTEQITILS